jgi:serine phosphatase RsbU (regulator of sigma subunit)
VGTPTPPLGTGLPITPAIAEVDLADGDTLLLYSDGLLEAHAPDRTVDPMDLPDLLARVGTLELGDGLVSVCSELVGGPGQGRDDLAILAARRKAVV